MKLLSKTYVKYGLAMCGVIVACLALMEITGQNKSFDKSPIQLIFMMLSPLVIWFLGILSKKKQQKNKLTFKQGTIEGIKISLVYGLVSPFIFVAYYLFVNPEIISYVKNSYGLGTAPDAVAILVDMLAQLITALIFGTVYAAIISFFLKSKS